MARGTNLFFNNFANQDEQNLINDLAYESIKIYGIDCGYMAFTEDDTDDILGEARKKYYGAFSHIEMYVKNVEGFEGEGEFLSRFGLDIRDQITFTVAIRRFEQLESGKPRPAEGDLIYFPLNKKLFQVQFVEHESIFYPTGSLPVYDLRCELFVYNQQPIATGITEIDAIGTAQAFTANALATASTTEDNLTIEDEAKSILDFSDSNPFGSF